MDVDRSAAALSEVLFTLGAFAVGVAILEGILYLVLVRWLNARLALPIDVTWLAMSMPSCLRIARATAPAATPRCWATA